MGGFSAEREISLKTGQAILQALQSQGWNAVGIDVDRSLASQLGEEGIEVAFIALHGRYGEDGCVQGLLEFLNIPYTGSGVQSSALALDKALSKKLFAQHGLPTPDWKLFPADELEQNDFKAEMPFPSAVVKPINEGSSVGISICHDKEAFSAALREAAKYDRTILVEQFVEGRELTVALFEGDVWGVLEIRPGVDFYDFEAKYQRNDTQYLCPAPISDELAAEARRLAAETHSLLGCNGLTRADFLLDEAGQLWLLELNTLPGMTATSLAPKIAAAGPGLSFAELCERIVLNASLKTGAAS